MMWREAYQNTTCGCCCVVVCHSHSKRVVAVVLSFVIHIPREGQQVADVSAKYS